MRRVEQVRLLGDDADGARERPEGDVADVDPVKQNAAALDLVQPRGQVPERRLAGAGLADDCRARPGRHVEGDVFQRPRGVGGVAEPDVVEGHVAAAGRKRHRVRALVDLYRQVEVLEDPVEEGE